MSRRKFNRLQRFIMRSAVKIAVSQGAQGIALLMTDVREQVRTNFSDVITRELYLRQCLGRFPEKSNHVIDAEAKVVS